MSMPLRCTIGINKALHMRITMEQSGKKCKAVEFLERYAIPSFKNIAIYWQNTGAKGQKEMRVDLEYNVNIYWCHDHVK